MNLAKQIDLVRIYLSPNSYDRLLNSTTRYSTARVSTCETRLCTIPFYVPRPLFEAQYHSRISYEREHTSGFWHYDREQLIEGGFALAELSQAHPVF